MNRETRDCVFIGVHLPGHEGVSNELVVDLAVDEGYNFITSKITAPGYRDTVSDYLGVSLDKIVEQERKLREACAGKNSTQCEITYDSTDDPRGNAVNSLPHPLIDDVALLPGAHTYRTMGVCAPWTNISSVDPWFARLSYYVIRNELQYAHYCGLTYVLLDMSGRSTVDNEYYISALVHEFKKINIVILFDFDSWHLWDRIRVLCGYSENLTVGLNLSDADYNEHMDAVKTWKCEPVKAIFLSHSKIHPLESAAERLEPIMSELTVLDPFLIIDEDEGHHHDTFCQNFVNLINFLLKLSTREFADSIRFPLQPLSQPLTSDVYEVFQSDASKYTIYFEAILSALDDLKRLGLTRPITVTLAGAGKGGLIEPTLNAIKQAGIDVECLYAVEKFIGPVISLQARQRVEKDWAIVQIVHADVRRWVPPEPTSVIISELLGSFGDNELSPECLQPMESNPKVLAPHGIMIPQSYTSFAAPVFCPLIWQKARESNDGSQNPDCENLDIPRVVKLNQARILAEAAAVWTFKHPLPNNPMQRQAKVVFDVDVQSRVYGFAGFFEAVLYNDVKISTLPPSSQCVSWYPFMFLLSKPLDVYPDTKVGFTLMREGNDKQAWYEWFADTETISPSRVITCIHNKNGVSCHMHL